MSVYCRIRNFELLYVVRMSSVKTIRTRQEKFTTNSRNKYVTTEIKVKLGEMNAVLIALIDRIRMLDNDIIRLRSKVNTVLELREKDKKPTSKK